MPITPPPLDNRTYRELLAEALARIPVHTREWTNFNESDPGVTLIELFAFLTESLLYRANQIPERNRLKFLSLLGVPLQPPASAHGLVSFANVSGELRTLTLERDQELRAGEVPFRTTMGLDVLPVEARVYYKRSYDQISPQLKDYYRQLYASYRGTAPPAELDFKLYETVPLDGARGINLGSDTVDHSLWIALLARTQDTVTDARKEIAGKTLSLGVAPLLEDARRTVLPGGHANPEGEQLLRYCIPQIPPGGMLPKDPQKRVAAYKQLDHRGERNVLAEPGVVQITLPGHPDELQLWKNVDPLEQGVGNFPPAIVDSNLNSRVITWIRIDSPAAPKVGLLWVGINAATVSQLARVENERLPDGNGEPDQAVLLSKTPVIPKLVRLTVNGEEAPWQEIDDLTWAGPEVPVVDPRQAPESATLAGDPIRVFALDPESGRIRFGDGARGMRPPVGASIVAQYCYGVGREGNVNAGAIKDAPALPSGVKVTNPIPTWGGAEGETQSQGEKQISRYLQHRDRLVNAEDFRTITLRAPGVDIGRVEVVAAYNPELGGNEPGDAPGAVTLMLIPRYDGKQPEAPLPDKLFIDTVCKYLEPRRLVTTELFLRGPSYKKIWVSAGINVVAGKSTSIAQVREAVKKEIYRFLSPLPAARINQECDYPFNYHPDGWPLWNPVVAKELVAVISRVPGVSLVNGVLLAEGARSPDEQVGMKGLELPQLAGVFVSVGDPVELGQLRGETAATAQQPGSVSDGAQPAVLPVPLIPEECI